MAANDPDYPITVMAQAAGPLGEVPGNVSFVVGGMEVMRFEPDGRIYVRGQLAETDPAVVAGIREFLRMSEGVGVRFAPSGDGPMPVMGPDFE